MLYIFCYKVFIVNKLTVISCSLTTVGSMKLSSKVAYFCIDFLSENSNADHFEVICCFACRIQSLIDFCVKEKRAGQMHFFIDAGLIRSATNRYCCTVIWELRIRTLVTPHAKSAGQFS